MRSLSTGICGVLALACVVPPLPAIAQIPDGGPPGSITNVTGALEPCPAPPGEVVVLPTTGFAFSLPPDPETLEARCWPDIPPQPLRPLPPDIFRMRALQAGTPPSLEKWKQARFGALADHPGSWGELLEFLAHQRGLDQIATVNHWVNSRLVYRDDVAGDEWSAGGTTLQRGFGDCEDFALAKLALLAASGRRSDEMYLVLLRDDRKTDHAVLAVREGGRLYVLDNRTDRLQPAEAIDDYVPVLSFSGPFAWTYGRDMR